MKYTLMIICLIVAGCSSASKITSIIYVPKTFKIVAQGENSGIEQRLVVVCYNKYFNETQFGKQFNSKHNLNQISFILDKAKF